MAAGDLDDISERLYALPPEDFTATRDNEARSVDDKQLRAAVKALRRPTVPAWLVNRLAAEQPELLDQLLDLGPALAAAQQEGRGDALRELGQQRRALVAAVAGAAVDLGGRPVTAQVRLEVEQTLEAALADPASDEAVRSGRLVRALTYAGFGGVDLDGAVAVPSSRRRSPARTAATSERKDKPAAVAVAESAALAAAAALDDAVRACEDAERERAEVEEAAGQEAREAELAAADVDRLERELAAARERASRTRTAAEAAPRRADTARSATGTATAAVTAAQEAAERARAELDRLRRS